MRSHLRWIAPALVLGIAAVLRFWALGRPGTLVFDELFYVRDAISQLAHGFPTTWPDDDPGMDGARATAFTDDPSNAVHPPLGKWLIGLGVLVFGPGNGWGWRSAVAVAGVLTVAVVMRLTWRMSRSTVIACLAGLLLAIDGVHVTLTRVALLDGFLTLFVALGALFVWRDLESRDERRSPPRSSAEGIPIRWWRPWLLASGLAFGAAAAVKWSGLYPLAFFLLLVIARDVLLRLRASEPRALLRAASGTGIAASIALAAALLAYLASWAGWIGSPGAWGRGRDEPWIVSLVRYHWEMWDWHSTLSASHPFQAHPLTWPLALRPTGMYEARWQSDCPWAECVSGITSLPNPIVTWAGVAALIVLGWFAARRAWETRRSAPVDARPDPIILIGAFVVVGYLSGWLPWMLTFSRSAVFQFYAVVLTPFSAIALALLLGMLCGISIRSHAGTAGALGFSQDADALRGRRAAVALFLVLALVLAVLFFPVWSGMPVAGWFWEAHMWLPGWD